MQKFTSVSDIIDPARLVEEALALKAAPWSKSSLGHQKTLLSLFFNPSLRTRLSTELAAQHLGMYNIVMNAGEGWKLEFADGAIMNLDKAEHIREAAGVMSQYADILAVRSFPSLQDRQADYADTIIQAFAEHATIPVVSLESAILHPLQSLADWMTIEEHKKKQRPKVVLSWAPHPKALPQAVATSFLEWINPSEVDLVLTHPEGYELAEQYTEGVPVYHQQEEAFQDADFIYAKNWSSYSSYGQKPEVKGDWTISADKINKTNDAYFMHCLPVRRNVVVSDAVLDSSHSLVLHQARNRVFAAQAVLARILNQITT